MPTLVNDLSQSQQLWLFETFGPGSTDAEDHFNHRGDDPAIADASHFDASTERRVSDATSVQGEHSSSTASVSTPTPAAAAGDQFSPHPHLHHNNSNSNNMDYYLPHAPDLQHHQPAPSGHIDNRNTIFRRGVENEMADLPPRPWSPADQFNNSPYPANHHQHHHQHHPSPAAPGFDHNMIGPSRSFNLLRQPRGTANSRPLMGNHHHHHHHHLHNEDATIVQKRISPMDASTGGGGGEPHHHPHPSASSGTSPYYPHKGEKLTWQQSFENLQVYKQTYGDCDVPQKYKHNVKLGGWVNKQRKKKKNPSKYGKLSDAQVSMMESIGFKWNVEQGC